MINKAGKARQRQPRKDPIQEEIVSGKDSVNDRMSKLIVLIKEVKKGLNGGPAPGIGVGEKFNLTAPLPDQVPSAAQAAAQELESILSEIQSIDSKQDSYSAERTEKLTQRLQKMQEMQSQVEQPQEEQIDPEQQAAAMFEMHELQKIASSKLSRIWSHIVAPFGTEKGKWERLRMLRALARMDNELKELQNKILTKDPSIGDAVQIAKQMYFDSKASFFAEFKDSVDEMLASGTESLKQMKVDEKEQDAIFKEQEREHKEQSKAQERERKELDKAELKENKAKEKKRVRQEKEQIQTDKLSEKERFKIREEERKEQREIKKEERWKKKLDEDMERTKEILRIKNKFKSSPKSKEDIPKSLETIDPPEPSESSESSETIEPVSEIGSETSLPKEDVPTEPSEPSEPSEPTKPTEPSAVEPEASEPSEPSEASESVKKTSPSKSEHIPGLNQISPAQEAGIDNIRGSVVDMMKGIRNIGVPPEEPWKSTILEARGYVNAYRIAVEMSETPQNIENLVRAIGRLHSYAKEYEVQSSMREVEGFVPSIDEGKINSQVDEFYKTWATAIDTAMKTPLKTTASNRFGRGFKRMMNNLSFRKDKHLRSSVDQSVERARTDLSRMMDNLEKRDIDFRSLVSDSEGFYDSIIAVFDNIYSLGEMYNSRTSDNPKGRVKREDLSIVKSIRSEFEKVRTSITKLVAIEKLIEDMKKGDRERQVSEEFEAPA